MQKWSLKFKLVIGNTKYIGIFGLILKDLEILKSCFIFSQVATCMYEIFAKGRKLLPLGRYEPNDQHLECFVLYVFHLLNWLCWHQHHHQHSIVNPIEVHEEPLVNPAVLWELSLCKYFIMKAIAYINLLCKDNQSKLI